MRLLQFFRSELVGRTVGLALVMHFLNISIDPVDMTPSCVPEDLSINEIESMTELIAEVILGVDGFLSEIDDDDTDSTFGFNVYFVVDNQSVINIERRSPRRCKPGSISSQSDILSPIITISTPPPKLV